MHAWSPTVLRYVCDSENEECETIDLIWGINPHFDFLKTIRVSPNSGKALFKQYLWSEGHILENSMWCYYIKRENVQIIQY